MFRKILKQTKIENDIEFYGHFGATLSVVEISLGSILHGFHIPFSGIFLSLNQGFLLCRAALLSQNMENSVWITYGISNVAAVLKSLSPAGKKIGPMLSISMQGLLFNFGTALFGVNQFGLIVGMLLLSVWTFLQPLITYYIFFGKKLFEAVEYLFEKTLPVYGIQTKYVVWIFFGVVVLKAITSIVLAILAVRTTGLSKIQDRLIDYAEQKNILVTDNKTSNSIIVLVVKDLFKPLFLVSLLMTGIFLYYSESDKSIVIWYLLRPIAIAFIFFYFSRTLTLVRWLKIIENGRFRKFSLGCQHALEKVRRIF
ncbi:MAG: hypothetical protein WA160_13490 [Pseudobdellovibrio sp.]